MFFNKNLAFDVLSGTVGYASNKAIVELGVDKLLTAVNQPFITQNADIIGGLTGLFITAPLTKPIFEQVEKLPVLHSVLKTIDFDPNKAVFGAAMWAGGRTLAAIISRVQGVGPLEGFFKPISPYLQH